jgi:hypothetical protein
MKFFCTLLWRLAWIGQGCQRKSYSGNLSPSVNHLNDLNIRRIVLQWTKLPSLTLISNHPLDKIFGDIPA